MGFFSALFGFLGFGVGVSAGLVIGYYLFIYFQPSDVKVCACSFLGFYVLIWLFGACICLCMDCVVWILGFVV